MNFDEWWNEDYDDSENPFEKDSFGYWAYAGWCAALAKPEQEPANRLKQLEREGCRYANECELEIKRLQNQGCAECGVKSSDGWALYCVKCSEPMREWLDLTDEEISQAVGCSSLNETYLSYFRKVIAKLKEKNT